MSQPAQGVPVVGIGASAGGIEALESFFENMPPDSGLAFVVVLHLPAGRKSLLPDILARWTRMKVVVASEGLAVEADCVYLPPPGVAVTLRRGCWHLPELETRETSPITVLFDSLAAELGPEAIGVVLSGTGHDGSLGLKAIKEQGGFALVQGADASGPLHDGMPASAIAVGMVDIVAPVAEMADHILAVRQAKRLDDLPAAEADSARREICAILLQRLDHDFSGYKEHTFLRRVQRRMLATRISRMDEYVERLKSSRDEVAMLFQDLLIGVTSFFRDSEIFAALERMVVPRLFDGKDANDAIRVWVAGCSTGEEAYSIAMLLCEHAGRLDHPPSMQVFATDIHEPAIATARAGRYPSTLLQGMSPARLARFFVAGADGSFTVTKALRGLCTFSAHSLVRDPPYSRIDFVSCRNLLIYLDNDAQRIVVPAFHYSLVKNGILLLGSSETIPRHESLFSMLDRTSRIFQKRDVPTPPMRLSRAARLEAGRSQAGAPLATATHLAALTQMTHWANARMLERFAPAFVVVNADGLCLQYSSRINRYLELPPGAPNPSVVAMARGALGAVLRAGLKQAVASGKVVDRPPVALGIPGAGIRQVAVTIEPHHRKDVDALYLVVFTELPQEAERPAAADHDGWPAGTELRESREQLGIMTEEYGTAVEELRIANEELLSINEEFQSTNEELETSKEEIQSINEELHTVNAQLTLKIDELDSRNSDLRNLFESTEVATLYLDPHLVVRSFTPALANLYSLIPSDQGRSITDIVARVRYDGLREDVRQVLDRLEPLERRVTSTDGKAHYLVRILPYRRPDSRVDGAIITFIEVTGIVAAEQHQRLLVDELNHRVKNMLTVVFSLATQTLRRSDSLKAFSATFLGRLLALTNAYSLLSAEHWHTVSVRDLVAEELKAFINEECCNVTLEGPRVRIGPRAALTLGMAVHELTTNAVKYGALSVEQGHLRVAWQLIREPDAELLYLEWIEKDGPAVTEPAHRGFGSTLIERGLRQEMSATVKVEFDADGLKVRIWAPLGEHASAEGQWPRDAAPSANMAAGDGA